MLWDLKYVGYKNLLEAGTGVNIEEGALAPDFTAVDSEGKTVRLSGYRGKKPVVLVFNRGFG
jgi:peroxiredoxin